MQDKILQVVDKCIQEIKTLEDKNLNAENKFTYGLPNDIDRAVKMIEAYFSRPAC